MRHVAGHPGEEPRSGCIVTYNAEAAYGGFNYLHQNPRCPFGVPSGYGGVSISYSGSMRVPSGTPAGSLNPNSVNPASLRVVFFDALRYRLDNDLSSTYRRDPGLGGDSARAEPTGTYLAGRQGVAFGSDLGVGPGQRQNLDFSFNDTEVSYSQTPARGTVFLNYEAERLAIVGPSGAVQYEPFTLSAEIRAPGAAAPVTYEWFEDGYSMGPADANASSMTASATAGSHVYRVVARDAAGRWEERSHSMYMTYNGSGCLQEPCP